MKIINNILLASALLFILACASVVVFTSQVGVGDAAEPNFHSVIREMATSSVGVVAASEIASEPNNRACASRVITTYADISLSFDGDVTPTASVGHFQAGTSTVAYDSAIYGCGDISAIARSATTTISVSTFVF